MRIRSVVILAAIAALCLSACGGSDKPTSSTAEQRAKCGGERPAKPGGGRYSCTFTDDFNRSVLDSSKWVVATTAQGGFTTGSTTARDCYVDSPNNISVSRGQLHLTSRVEASPFTCHSPLGDFTTSQTGGSIVSFGKFAQIYGRFEFRAKFPKATTAGIDSALWLYPQTPIYGDWPNSGEIDVAEWFGDGRSNQILHSVHYAGENTAVSAGNYCVVPTANSAFHSYAVDWTTTTMSFYYDNQLCFQHAWTPAAPLVAPQPFDNAFDLVMTQTGGSNAPPGTRITMDIDWVRAWK